MPIPLVLIDLTSVTGCVTDFSHIYTSSKDATKTPVKYFDFMVHSKEKVTLLFVSRHRSDHLLRYVTESAKNGGIECKKVRASDSNDYLLYSFSKVKSFIKLREEGTIVRNTINSEHLEFMLYIREGKH